MQKTETASVQSIGVDCVREIANLNTQFDIFRFLKRLTEAWEFRAFMVLDLTTEVSSELSHYTVITSWPAELLQRYDEEGELQNSRVMARLRKSTVPFSVSLDFLVEGEGHVLATRRPCRKPDLRSFFTFPATSLPGCPKSAVSISACRKH